MNLTQVTEIAERIRAELAPHCERIEIVGSIRRRKSEVSDMVHTCCEKIPVWFRWPTGRWAVECAFCHRRGCDATEKRKALKYWNDELRDPESVPWYPPNH